MARRNQQESSPYTQMSIFDQQKPSIPAFDKIGWPKDMAPLHRENIYRYMLKNNISDWTEAREKMLAEDNESPRHAQTGDIY